MRQNSRRFHRAMDLAAHALAHSDIDVLRAVIATLDPGTWLDRAAHTHGRAGREALVAVARALERLDIWAAAQSMFRRIQADHLALRVAWPDAPRMATREVLLHALRLALIHRIWLLATEISDFSPRHGVTRPVLEAAILRLDIEAALEVLAEIFPAAPDPSADCDYAEPAAPRGTAAYAREHAEIFAPDASAVRHGARDRHRDHARGRGVRVGSDCSRPVIDRTGSSARTSSRHHSHQIRLTATHGAAPPLSSYPLYRHPRESGDPGDRQLLCTPGFPLSRE